MPRQTPVITADPKAQRKFVIDCWNAMMDDVADTLARHPDAVHWREPETRNTGLTYAAAHGVHAFEVAKLLIGAGVDVDAQNRDGMTALMFAAKGGSEAYVDLLLAAGADQGLRNNEGRTARDIAAGKGSAWILQLFDRHNAQKAQAARIAAEKDLAQDIARFRDGSPRPVAVRRPLRLCPKRPG